MVSKANIDFLDFFKKIPDHRINRKKLYSVEEILLLAFCGMIAGCDSWNDLELFGKTQVAYLRKFLPYQNGIPSDDTLRRFFRVLDPATFEQYFMDWVDSFQLDLKQKVVAIDGKTSRRSFSGNERPMHLISAFVSELGITLGQCKTEQKSNEITAIPQLLEMLDLEGAIITLDSMGCQKKIVNQIQKGKADYVIGLKGNQPNLNNDVRLFFDKKPQKTVFKSHQTIDKGHGRLETRTCTVCHDIKWLRQRHPSWTGLNSLIEIESQREIKGVITVEKRYYISSLISEASQCLQAVRHHWHVENQLHWVLDVVFSDDQSRIRKGNAPQNIAIIKKTVLNLLRIIKKTMPRVSFKAMRKLAGWDQSFLDKVLMARF